MAFFMFFALIINLSKGILVIAVVPLAPANNAGLSRANPLFSISHLL